MKKIVIVGGVAGGASAAARARRIDENASIVMFERGPFVSFANCGLPYHVSNVIEDRNKLLLQTPESFKARFNVDVRVNQSVESIDRTNKVVVVKNMLTGEEYQEPYDKLLLSPGASPVIPPISGLANPLTFSLRNIPDMDKIIAAVKANNIKHATVVGGGFIGLEMVEAFRHLNIETALIEGQPHVMPNIDAEMAGFLHQEINANQVEMHLGAILTSVEYDAEKAQPLRLTLSNDKQVDTQLVVMSVGIRPEVTLAKEAGLDLGKRGGIRIDACMQTSDPDIYAAGDAVETADFITGEHAVVPLAGPANRQGRYAAENMLGGEITYKGTQGTAICKVFDLAVGSVGKSEKQLKAAGIDYEKVYVHSASHAGYYPGAEVVSLKLMFAPESGKILGAQAVGKDGIDKRIDVLAVAQRAGMTVEDLQDLELSYAPPYGSAKDVINQAGFVASNVLKGDITLVHYDEINEAEGKVILDVRNPGELAKLGQIDNAVNIPVDQLRQRMHELPKDKEILVYCQVGLRGNVATRMLQNSGFTCKNMTGGYRTYMAAKA